MTTNTTKPISTRVSIKDYFLIIDEMNGKGIPTVSDWILLQIKEARDAKMKNVPLEKENKNVEGLNQSAGGNNDETINELSSLVYELTKENVKLTKENLELKKQLEEEHIRGNGFCDLRRTLLKNWKKFERKKIIEVRSLNDQINRLKREIKHQQL